MAKMLAYRDRPAAEWTPLFWSVLRSRIIDMQRRRVFRLSWLTEARDADGGEVDWADDGTPEALYPQVDALYARLCAEAGL